MKTIIMLVATAALVTGISAANAPGTTKQMDEQAGGNSGAAVDYRRSWFTEDAGGER